jgi:hypothetical protein
MFKKIEIWVLYLVLVFVFISYIIFGAILRRELKGGGPYMPVITPLSKVVVFLSEIPHNLKYMKSHDVRTPNQTWENRFGSLSGFIGNHHEDEMFLLLSRFDGDISEAVIELINLKNFEVIHRWNPNFDEIWTNIDDKEKVNWPNMDRDFNDKRFRPMHPHLEANGSLILQNHSPLIKINHKSELEWIKSDVLYHHSNEEDIDGNVWVCVRYYPYKIDSMYVGNKFDNYRDNGIRKISSDGEILFDRSLSQLLIDKSLEHLLFSNAESFKKDPIHLNDIQPAFTDTKYWKKGDLFLSFRNLSMTMLYRPSSDSIIWTSLGGKFFNQHDVNILNNNQISIFNNNAKWLYDGLRVDGYNNMVIYDFSNNQYKNYLSESFINEDVRTWIEGRGTILPNGDLFIEETRSGRLLYFNSDGSLRWTHVNRGNNGKVYYTGWCRILYENEDIEKVNRFLKIKNEITYNE